MWKLHFRLRYIEMKSIGVLHDNINNIFDAYILFGVFSLKTKLFKQTCCRFCIFRDDLRIK